MNPYFIDEPAAISFSGGRTSAYMLYRILEAHGGTLPDYVKVTFANTGKEMNETLDFVRDCGEQWGVDIVWLEFVQEKKQGREVSYDSASRNGEPFAELITQKRFIPNDRLRICTQELKVSPIRFYMSGLGFDEFLSVVGIRADEQRRVAKYLSKPEYSLPLAVDGVGIRDIDSFWKEQDFRLELPLATDGNSPLSNCDLCFFKSMSRKQSIIRESPARADWWIEQEERIGNVFRRSHPSYAEQKKMALGQGGLFDFNDETIPCFCGD